MYLSLFCSYHMCPYRDSTFYIPSYSLSVVIFCITFIGTISVRVVGGSSRGHTVNVCVSRSERAGLRGHVCRTGISQVDETIISFCFANKH